MIKPFFTFLNTFYGQKPTSSPQGRADQAQADSEKIEGIPPLVATRTLRR